MTTLTRKSPAGAHKPFANYSHVVTAQGANKLVFCAGQVAADPSGKVLPPDDFAAQTKMVMENLKLALAEGGANLECVLNLPVGRRSIYAKGLVRVLHAPDPI
jgi:enamine deaminase RidA (YjgF/YER057c/UK114 family)